MLLARQAYRHRLFQLQLRLLAPLVFLARSAQLVPLAHPARRVMLVLLVFPVQSDLSAPLVFLAQSVQLVPPVYLAYLVLLVLLV